MKGARRKSSVSTSSLPSSQRRQTLSLQLLTSNPNDSVDSRDHRLFLSVRRPRSLLQPFLLPVTDMAETSPPRRRLPWDVLLLVFKEADPSTLAVLGRVSYDFLTATAPELYRDVVVTSVKQLERLFCRRIERKTKNSSKISSRINSHLSLSQIQTLTLEFSSVPAPKAISISSSRLDDERPIPLDYLGISLDYSKTESLPPLYSSLFPKLNPNRCSYQVAGRPFTSVRWVDLDGQSNSLLLGWTRIRSLDIVGVFPFMFFNNYDHLAGLPSPSPDHRRVLRLHVTSLRYRSLNLPDIKPLLDDVGDHSDVFELDGMQDESVVLVVKSEEEKGEVEAAVRASQKLARWRHVFVVELEI
ncbi:hypothetical protein BDY24DRAFT_389216 [Mrakia frigida]|uniref:uncharacterized protein n=1 Tax=Mrakia frigida TaxID=29902 RepID=UPI003FCC0844